MPRFYHTPKWVRRLFKGMTWARPGNDPVVYLTFDDGPDPGTTQWILDCLSEYQAYGTFFCVGANASAYPQLLNAITNNGHRLGNHTQHHLDGWQNSFEAYLQDARACAKVVNSPLFRPPYGKIRPKQARKLKAEGYDIVMWSVLTYDFDPEVDIDQVFDRCIRAVEPGSIVLFHDNSKAFGNLEALLPLFLRRLSEAGYRFETL